MSELDHQRGIVSAQLLCQLAQEEGVSLATVLANTGISMATLGNPHSRILARQELQLIQNVIRHVPEPVGLGLRLGQRYRLANYGVFGFGLSSSATLQEAALFGLRFIGLSYAFSQFELRFTPERVQVHFSAHKVPQEVRSFVIERDMSALMSLVKEVTGKPQRCERVYFTHGESAAFAWAKAHFGVAPQGAQAQNMAEIPLKVFYQPLPQADAATHQLCTKECQALLAQLQQQQRWAERVRHVLETAPSLATTMEEVAQRLFVSSRTLRRHLRAENTNFRELLETVREDHAKHLLESSSKSVKQVAEAVGYQEPASFVHAFKRWTGFTPGQWREAQGNSPKQ